MKCPRCGGQIGIGATRCPRCASSLGKAMAVGALTPPPAEQPADRNDVTTFDRDDVTTFDRDDVTTFDRDDVTAFNVGREDLTIVPPISHLATLPEPPTKGD